MTHFTVNTFQGSRPRVSGHLLNPGMAESAVDCKLEDGTLWSFRKPKKTIDVGEDTKTVYLHNCCWLQFDNCVDIVEGPVNCRRIFVTGYKEYPMSIESTVDPDTGQCVIEEFRLGLPCPTTAPTMTIGAQGASVNKDYEGRSYGYQYVNSYGERSALSPGCRAQNVRDGQTCVVSGWAVPDESWGVVSIRIYRTVTGHQSGREAGNLPDTTWMFVAEIDIDDVLYEDTIMNDRLMWALEEDEVTPPPAGLRGIVWIESMNTLAGFVGKRVYFSENNQYHNWSHYIDLDDNVCALVESNGVFYAATDGHPYVIEGAVECQNAHCRQAIRLPYRFPMVGCGNRRMAKTALGAVYPSHEGLISLSGKAKPDILTWELYTAAQWQAMMPETAIPVEHNGVMYVFLRNGAFSFVMGNSPKQGWKMDFHTDLSDRGVVDAYASREGDLYVLKTEETDGDFGEGGFGVYLWDRGMEKRPHQWTSSEYVSRFPVGFGAFKLHFQYTQEHVKIQTRDGPNWRTPVDRDVLSAREIRLPMWAFGTRWRFTVTGTGRVTLASLATSMSDLGG